MSLGAVEHYRAVRARLWNPPIRKSATYYQLSPEQAQAEREAAFLETYKAPAPRGPTVATILAAVCVFYGISYNEIISGQRGGGLVRARQVVMYLARQMTPLPLSVIGKHLGNRDHSTILHGVQKLTATLENEEAGELAAEISAIRKHIRSTKGRTDHACHCTTDQRS